MSLTYCGDTRQRHQYRRISNLTHGIKLPNGDLDYPRRLCLMVVCGNCGQSAMLTWQPGEMTPDEADRLYPRAAAVSLSQDWLEANAEPDDFVTLGVK